MPLMFSASAPLTMEEVTRDLKKARREYRDTLSLHPDHADAKAALERLDSESD